MCKVFPSSLRPVVMRWFDGLGADSINSFKELTQAFSSRFITCSRAPRPLETLKTHLDRYWEIFNEINGDFDDVAMSTFKVGLSTEHNLRKSLMGKPVTSLHQLMYRIDKYKRVEEDQQQGKVRLRLSLKRGGISSRTSTIKTYLGETLLGSQGLPILRGLMWCSENRCTRFWRRSRMSRSSNGQIKWQETP